MIKRFEETARTNRLIGLWALAALALLALSLPVWARAGIAHEARDLLPSEEVFVPAGAFSMGCAPDYNYELCDADAQPIHTVYLEAFYIDRTEVTNAQYRACEEAGVCPHPIADSSETRPDYYTNPRYDNYPMINVDWHRANIYCQWVGKRLPTEAEWEKAARGTDVRWFPWGNEEITCELANYKTGIWPHEHYCVGDTVAVGSYPANVSPYGALDMVGNVGEWVADLYESRYYHTSPYYAPTGPEQTDKNEHLLRGGSWADSWRAVTTYVRLDESETYKYLRIGFRCAHSGPAPVPTLTPTPTPTSTPTPTPFAVDSIGPEGGTLWMADQAHLTLVRVPPNVVTDSTVFTLSYAYYPDLQEDLQGIGHFFHLETDSHWSPGGTLGTARFPLQLILGFDESPPVIADSLQLYRLGAGGWLTEQISTTDKTPGYLVAFTDRLGTFGLMGRVHRCYLPVTIRD